MAAANASPSADPSLTLGDGVDPSLTLRVGVFALAVAVKNNCSGVEVQRQLSLAR
jgi:hypothetical protein